MQSIVAGSVEMCTLILSGHIYTKTLWQRGENMLVVALNAACYAMVRGTKFGTIVKWTLKTTSQDFLALKARCLVDHARRSAIIM